MAVNGARVRDADAEIVDFGELEGELEGQPLVRLSDDAWELLNNVARVLGVTVGQVLVDAISLESAVVSEAHGKPDRLFVKRSDGVTVELVAK
jgi:hypothetical protein